MMKEIVSVKRTFLDRVFRSKLNKKSKILNQFFSTLVNFWKLFDVMQITTEGLENDISFNFLR